MAKLIDDEKLLAVIEEHCYTLCDRFNSTDKGMFLCGIKQAINEQPTVDTERHAHWIELPTYANEIYKVYKCSSCERILIVDIDNGQTLDDYPYCHCGCKMDKTHVL